MTKKKYTSTEVARLREQMIQDQVLPIITRAFDSFPSLKSATLLVAQFWCDEAIDAVHCDLIFSELNTPDLGAAYLARRRRYESFGGQPIIEAQRAAVQQVGWRKWLPWFGAAKSATMSSVLPSATSPKGDIVNLPSGIDDEKLEDEFVDELPWDSNGEPISLFAAFCLEGCHQEMEEDEVYTPYAIFRRENGNVSTTVVGVMTRPWLDGVKPE